MKKEIGFVKCLAGCGTDVAVKTTKRVCCEACRAERKREAARRTAEKKRRARGVLPVKGVSFICARCGIDFVRYSVKTTRCQPCQQTAMLERARKESLKRKTDASKREYQNAWMRNKIKKDPAWMVSAHMRTLMHRALGKKKAGKSWRDFVDYSVEDLVQHLERQFVDGMTWVNRGKWHIDHIVPRASFNYETPGDPEFKACWSLSNLRPMWALDNIRKNAKIEYLL